MNLRRIIRYNFSKIFDCPKKAVQGIKDGDFLLIGGFGLCGLPNNLIQGLWENGAKNLTVASNDVGSGDRDGNNALGPQILIKNGQIKRMISSYLGWNQHFEHLYLNGHIELQFCPQGTLAQKIRSGGAGIPAFYTHTGVDSMVQKGGMPIKYYPQSNIPEIVSEPKQTKVINGKKYLLEHSFFADYAYVKAYKADRYGNLVFNYTARNFNQDMATAAKCVIAQVQEIVQNGQIAPNQIHLPGVYVHRVFKCDPNNPCSFKPIQRPKFSLNTTSLQNQDPVRVKIMKRAAKQVRDGMDINLGIGIPTLLPQCLPKGVKINVHSQNGVLGVGPYPQKGKQNPDIINAGKQSITINAGGSVFPSSRSFDIIRGGHLDITMLGAMQVSETGDIANWMIPGKKVKGMGGAMDLVASGSKVIVVMQHTAKCTKKLLKNCTLPLTAKGKASMVITQKAVFENRNGKLILIEIAQGVSLEQLQSQTGFQIQKVDNLKTF